MARRATVTHDQRISAAGRILHHIKAEALFNFTSLAASSIVVRSVSVFQNNQPSFAPATKATLCRTADPRGLRPRRPS